MSCSCFIEVEHSGGPDPFSERYPIARKVHKCCECYRDILPGEKYEVVTGKWDGHWDTYKTCIDCQSARNNLFCTWTYETIWEDIKNDIAQANGEPPPSECMVAMTRVARNKVCDIVQEMWDEDE